MSTGLLGRYRFLATWNNPFAIEVFKFVCYATLCLCGDRFSSQTHKLPSRSTSRQHLSPHLTLAHIAPYTGWQRLCHAWVFPVGDDIGLYTFRHLINSLQGRNRRRTTNSCLSLQPVYLTGFSARRRDAEPPKDTGAKAARMFVLCPLPQIVSYSASAIPEC